MLIHLLDNAALPETLTATAVDPASNPTPTPIIGPAPVTTVTPAAVQTPILQPVVGVTPKQLLEINRPARLEVSFDPINERENDNR